MGIIYQVINVNYVHNQYKIVKIVIIKHNVHNVKMDII